MVRTRYQASSSHVSGCTRSKTAVRNHQTALGSKQKHRESSKKRKVQNWEIGEDYANHKEDEGADESYHDAVEEGSDEEVGESNDDEDESNDEEYRDQGTEDEDLAEHFLNKEKLKRLDKYNKQKGFFDRFVVEHHKKYIVLERSGPVVYNQEQLKTTMAWIKSSDLETGSFIQKWLKDEKREYHRINFEPYPPSRPIHDPKLFNLFQGYASQVEELENMEEVESLIKPWREVGLQLCEGSHKKLEQLEIWLAHLIQRPAERANLSFVFLGQSGLHKGNYFEPFRHIFGSSSCAFEKSLTDLKNEKNPTPRLLVTVTEFSFKESKRLMNFLKRFITNPSQEVRIGHGTKLPLSMPHRVVFQSNHTDDMYVDHDSKARRFIVLSPTTVFRDMKSSKVFKEMYVDRFVDLKHKHAWKHLNAIYTYLMQMEVPNRLDADDVMKKCSQHLSGSKLLQFEQTVSQATRFMFDFCKPHQSCVNDPFALFSPRTNAPKEKLERIIAEELNDHNHDIHNMYYHWDVTIRANHLYELYGEFCKRSNMKVKCASNTFSVEVKKLLNGALPGREIDEDDPSTYLVNYHGCERSIHHKNNGTPMFSFHTGKVYTYIKQVYYGGMDVNAVQNAKFERARIQKDSMERIDEIMENNKMFWKQRNNSHKK